MSAKGEELISRLKELEEEVDRLGKNNMWLYKEYSRINYENQQLEKENRRLKYYRTMVNKSINDIKTLENDLEGIDYEED